MRNLAKIRRRFFLVIFILGAICVGLSGYLLWPGTSAAAQKIQEESLQQQLRTLARDAAPLDGIDAKLLRTRVDIRNLYKDAIPGRASDISARLEKISQSAGVRTESVQYLAKEPGQEDKLDLPGMQREAVSTSIKGEYANVARFINAIEQDKFLFIIDQISLRSQEAGVVTLEITLHTFLKEA